MRPQVLVTGAARRVGRSIALTLAEKGFDVAVHYNRSEAAATEVVEQLSLIHISEPTRPY